MKIELWYRDITFKNYNMEVLFTLGKNAHMPHRGSEHAAGYDLYSAQECIIPAGCSASVETNVSIAIPDGYYGKVEARSGTSFKYDIETGAGVIDSDYRGSIGVKLYNHGQNDFVIENGQRIAQIIFQKHEVVNFVIADVLPDSKRGNAGFGSTGLTHPITNAPKLGPQENQTTIETLNIPPPSQLPRFNIKDNL